MLIQILYIKLMSKREYSKQNTSGQNKPLPIHGAGDSFPLESCESVSKISVPRIIIMVKVRR